LLNHIPNRPVCCEGPKFVAGIPVLDSDKVGFLLAGFFSGCLQLIECPELGAALTEDERPQEEKETQGDADHWPECMLKPVKFKNGFRLDVSIECIEIPQDGARTSLVL
jgi:hypothetical protein